jgi:hypothetical protein
MNKFFAIEPEVAGGLGVNTVIDRSGGKPVVRQLHYELQGWLGDALLESTPCFVATQALAAEIVQAGLSGAEFDAVEISRSPEFRERDPQRQLPDFVWLKTTGRAGVDDFGLDDDLLLVVSDRALAVLQRAGLSHHASITPL